MLPFFKKNNRQNGYYPNNNYQYMNNDFMPSNDFNMIDLELKEMKRQINAINTRLNRIEGYLGMREKSPSDY